MNPMTWKEGKQLVAAVALLLATSLTSAMAAEGPPAPEAVAAAPSASAEEGARSYDSLVNSNPFGLKPPATPPPPPPKQEEVVPKPEIILTGLTTLLEKPRAYLMTKDQKGQKEYYSLALNEMEDGLEVLHIDPKQKSVRILNGGVETLLTFATHGIKPPANAAPAQAQPGQPGGLPMPPSANVPSPVRPGVAGGSPRVRTIPTRAGAVPQRPLRTGVNPAGGFSGGGVQYAGSTPGEAPQQVIQPQHPEQPEISPEEQAVLLELQRAANPEIPLPPTPGLPETGAPPPMDAFDDPNMAPPAFPFPPPPGAQ